MLMETKRFEEARRAYEVALERTPNRFNSLYGAGRAAELAGDGETAVDYYRRLLAVAGESVDGRSRLKHAREVVG